MPCKWLGNSFRGFLRFDAGLRGGLTRFHTYFNTAEAVRKLRDTHKRLRKLGYSDGASRARRSKPLPAAIVFDDNSSGDASGDENGVEMNLLDDRSPVHL